MKRWLSLAMTAGLMAAGFQAAPPAAAGQSLVLKRQRCFQPVHKNHSVRVHCFKLYKLRNDNNDRRDFFALHHYGTARSKSGYRMKYFGLEAYRHEDGPRIKSWSDWSPRQDQERGRCGSITVGVSVGFASVSSNHTICDEWDITLFFEQPGHFRNVWRGTARQSEREVAYMIAVSVRQGKSPRWHFRSHTKTDQY